MLGALADPFSMISSYVMLTPAPNSTDPNHFVGSATIVHQDTPTDSGGEMLIDWTVTWDVRLSRH